MRETRTSGDQHQLLQRYFREARAQRLSAVWALAVTAETANASTFLRRTDLPEEMADWSLTRLQLKLIRIGARVGRQVRAITFQLAEVAATGPMVCAILAAIRRL